MVSAREKRKNRAKQLFENGDFTDVEISKEIGVTAPTLRTYKKELGFNSSNGKPRGAIDQLKQALTGLIPAFFTYEIIQNDEVIGKIADKFKSAFSDNPELITLLAASPLIWRQKIKPFLSNLDNSVLIDNLVKMFPYLKLVSIPVAIGFLGLFLGRKLGSYLAMGFDWVRPFFMGILEFFTAIAGYFGGTMEKAKAFLGVITDPLGSVEVKEDPKHPWLKPLFSGLKTGVEVFTPL